MFETVHQYLSFPMLETPLRQELEQLLRQAEDGDEASRVELEDRFSEPLAFGTGGLRGIMGAGLKRMNAPNVRRATMALAEVAQKRAAGRAVAVIGYDTRTNSEAYAREAARVLAAAGYKVYLGGKPYPTPYLCFAMRELGAGCGIILTASHNPKIYNGYKAYNDQGAQVVAPWDTEVEAAMNALPMVPAPPVGDFSQQIEFIPFELEERYLELGLKLLQKPECWRPAKLLYTPFHGTGIAFVPELFQRAGIPLHICGVQAVQDSSFPTAPRPNPEEMAAYKVTLEDAERLGVDAILAGDPDSDRLGVMARRKGQWELLQGNDMAALTLDYLCRHKGLKGVVITTVVTSDLLSAVAKRYGLETMFTLTGFKNIAECTSRLPLSGDSYAFSAEESIGMSLSDKIRDKDGITAALVMAELIGWYKTQGLGLFEAVDRLQEDYGWYHNRLVNLEDPRPGGAQRFAEAMGRIRQAGLQHFGGDKVVSWEDFRSGERHEGEQIEAILDRPEHTAVAKPIPSSNVLKFRLDSGGFAAFRPSGTEPKLKVYLQSRKSVEQLDAMEKEARELLGLG